MQTKLFNTLFLSILIVQVYAQYIGNFLLINFSKLLFITTLLIWLYLKTRLKGRFHKRIVTGLIFALAGEIFFSLQHRNTNFFSFGLIAFLLCYLFYIRAFILDHKSNPDYKNPYILWVTGALAIYCSGLFFYMQPHLQAIQFPILMYAIIITFMAIMAFNRYGKVNLYSFKLILTGTLFLILSNSVLAINMLVQPIPQSEILIVASYLIAQYFIVYGTISRKLVVTQTEI